MRFLADESCDGGVIRALRAVGHEVLCVAEFLRGGLDSAVMEVARAGAVTLLTEDKDFGHLVFALALPAPGVILIRWPVHARDEMVRSVVRLIDQQRDHLLTSFAVVEPGGVRIRPRPV